MKRSTLLLSIALRYKEWQDIDREIKLRQLRKVSRSIHKPMKETLDKPTRTGYNGSHKSSKADKRPAKGKREVDNANETG